MEAMEGGIDKISLISKRDVERKLQLQKRKDVKDNLAASNENLGLFQETFNNKRTQIENSLVNSQQIEQDKLPDHFDDISKEILLLQKYVANSNIFLRTYDIKIYQESIQDLTNKLRVLEDELLPKKKFAFKKKPKPKSQAKKSTDEVDVQKNKITFAPKEICGFKNRVGEILEIKAGEIHKKDVTLENLQNCKIEIFGSPSTLHLNYLENCYIFTGPVSTSIFAENCTDCTFVIACQQLRLHASNNVNIYLHVTSRAIMEDCKQIFLAPYNLNYDNIDKDFEESGLNKSSNNWKSVDDFNWLNVEKQSPNWSLLEQKNIITNWDDVTL